MVTILMRCSNYFWLHRFQSKILSRRDETSSFQYRVFSHSNYSIHRKESLKQTRPGVFVRESTISATTNAAEHNRLFFLIALKQHKNEFSWGLSQNKNQKNTGKKRAKLKKANKWKKWRKCERAIDNHSKINQFFFVWCYHLLLLLLLLSLNKVRANCEGELKNSKWAQGKVLRYLKGVIESKTT